MYKTNYLFSVDKLIKVFPNYSISNRTLYLNYKCTLTAGFSFVNYIFEVVLDKNLKYGFLQKVSYKDASRSVGERLLCVLREEGNSKFYSLTTNCQIEPISNDGNIAFRANSYQKAFFSENLSTDTDLELFSVSTPYEDFKDNIHVYYSKKMGGFLYESLKLNEAISLFKEKGVSYFNLHDISKINNGFTFVNKLYKNENSYYIFMPYNFNLLGQMNLFDYSANAYKDNLRYYYFPFADNGKMLSFSDLILTLKKDRAKHYFIKTNFSDEYMSSLESIIKNKLVPFKLNNHTFFSDKIFSSRSEEFKVGDFVNIRLSNKASIGEIFSIEPEEDSITVVEFNSMGRKVNKTKSYLLKNNDFKPCLNNNIIIFPDYFVRSYLFGFTSFSSSNRDLIIEIDGSDARQHFKNDEISKSKSIFSLSNEESDLFRKFSMTNHLNLNLVLDVIRLKFEIPVNSEKVMRTLLNALLSIYSLDVVLKNVISLLKTSENKFDFKFIEQNISVFKKILITN